MLLFAFLSLTCFLKENATKSSRIAEIKKRSFSSVSKVGIVIIKLGSHALARMSFL